MLFKALSAAVYGIDANLIEVEVDYSGVVASEDHFHTVGLPDAAVRESRDRVRAAIKNSGYLIPPTFITINLAPADLKKEGSGFDLPIAVGILGAYGALRSNDLSRFLLAGELGLDGGVRPIPGMLPIAILAREKGIPNLILPAANAAEAAVVEGVNVYPVSSLLDVLDLLNTSVVGQIQREPYRVVTEELLGKLEKFTVDFCDVRGQQTAKRALDPGSAHLRRSPRNHQDSLRRRRPRTRFRPGYAAALPLAPPHHLRRRPHRRRHHPAPRRGLTRAQRPPLPRRAARVSPQRPRSFAPAA
jgi:magnesium chelatase family protein